MALVNLPKTNQVGVNEWVDVQDNDEAIIAVVNGGLQNVNIQGNANIAYSKLANLATGQALIGNAGTPTATTLTNLSLGATGAVTGIVAAALATGSVTAAKLAADVESLIGTARDTALVATEQTTSSITWADLATVGPSVTVTVPTGGGVALCAVDVEMKLASGSGPAGVNINVTTDYPLASDSPAAVTSPSTGYLSNGNPLTAMKVIPVTAGARTFTLQYNTALGVTATFKNRGLHVVVLGGF